METHIANCTYCGARVLRVQKRPVVRCFDCKKRRQNEILNKKKKA